MAQFALAGSLGGLVIGTDDAAEAVMGFFTKCGDRAADLLPLADLTTRRESRGRVAFGRAPPELVWKVHTADLEDGMQMRPDEDVYGITYEQIDDYLEGKPVAHSATATIVPAYHGTAHRRALPVTSIWLPCLRAMSARP